MPQFMQNGVNKPLPEVISAAIMSAIYCILVHISGGLLQFETRSTAYRHFDRNRVIFIPILLIIFSLNTENILHHSGVHNCHLISPSYRSCGLNRLIEIKNRFDKEKYRELAI